MPAKNDSEHSQLPPALIGIPAFPAVAIQILRVAADEYARLREISALIRADAAFSTQILRTANSSLYGRYTKIESIMQATLLLGLERVKAIVLTAAMKTYLAELLNAPWMRACWRHNLACAVVAEQVATGTLTEPDVAYTAGLVHDIGRLAMAVSYLDRYGDFLAEPMETLGNVLAQERLRFGIDHCDAGRCLASLWQLPESLVEVISGHHEAPDSAEFDLLTIVSLSCRAADALGFEAIRPAAARAYSDWVSDLPERHRSRFPVEPEELALRVAAAINAIEMA